MEIEDAIMQMPHIGDTVTRTVTCYPYEDYEDSGVVVYVNKENMYYTVKFANGVKQSYKAVEGHVGI